MKRSVGVARLVVLVLAFGLLGCDLGPSNDAGVPPDAGTSGTGEPDAGDPDAGDPDAGDPDAGDPDAGVRDAGDPDAGEPDAGDPDAGDPDAGDPDAGEPDAGEPDAGNIDAGPLVFTGTFDPAQLILPPGALGRATVTFPRGVPSPLVVQVSGSATVTHPTATLGTCTDTNQTVSCEVTLSTSLETSVGTAWTIALSAAPGLPTTVASLGVLMADDPHLRAELVTSFKDAVLRQQGFFGKRVDLAGGANVAVFESSKTVSTQRCSVWRNDGGWAEEAFFEGGVAFTCAISRDGQRMVVPSLDGGRAGRVVTRTSAGWEEEAVIVGISTARTLSGDGTCLTAESQTSTRVFDRDAGTWNESFVGSLGSSAVSNDGLVLVTSVGSPNRIITVFRRSAGQWVFESNLVPRLGMRNGGELHLSSNGDTVAVLDLWMNEVEIFQRTNGSWSSEALMRPDPGYIQNQFGHSGQLSSDGDRLVIGAGAEYPDGGNFNGAVYIFTRRGSSWVRNLRVTSPAGTTGNLFGQSLSVSADGLQFLVGEPGNSTGAPGVDGNLFVPAPPSSGAAFLFRIVGDGGS